MSVLEKYESLKYNYFVHVRTFSRNVSFANLNLIYFGRKKKSFNRTEMRNTFILKYNRIYFYLFLNGEKSCTIVWYKI